MPFVAADGRAGTIDIDIDIDIDTDTLGRRRRVTPSNRQVRWPRGGARGLTGVDTTRRL